MPTAAYCGRPITTGCSSRWPCSAALHPGDVVDAHRAREALEEHLADPHRLDLVLQGAEEPAGDEDLAGLGLAAEARGQVGDGADGAVVPAALEADGPERRVPLGDADPEVELVPALAPAAHQLVHPLAHGQRHPHRALLRVGYRGGGGGEGDHAR